MTCQKLRAGLNASCIIPSTKYYQQVVLVNREDLLNKRIVTSSVTIDDEYLCRHRVFFNLKEGKTGYRFSINETASQIFGIAEKTTTEGIPQYSHSVNIVLLGIDEATKCLLKQLDYGDYFAALQFYGGTIEVFGFEYGLTTSNYSYDPQNLSGGAIIKLNSLSDSLEDELPFVYKSTTLNNEVIDFDNDFSENEFDVNGDFNADFNHDFNNQ
jgi:hypothetical protein